MTLAADDTDAIRAARERIKHEATTDDATGVCETCGNYGFVWRDEIFPSRAVPCGECKRRREAEK